jgi:prepilin-type N-terminal cleavage/methylation domain-containing protein
VSNKRRKSGFNVYCSKTAKQFQAGFTLIELLVVIAIIALLLSIIMPSLEKARNMAMRVRCANNLKQINLTMSMYVDSNDDVYPCAQDSDPQPPYGYWLWMGRWRSFVEPYLSTNITEDNPSVLLCPQDLNFDTDHESFSYAYSMTFYYSPEQIDDMNSVEDTFMFDRIRPSIPQCSLDVAKPAGKILSENGSVTTILLKMTRDGGAGRDAGTICLPMDGSVTLRSTKSVQPEMCSRMRTLRFTASKVLTQRLN